MKRAPIWMLAVAAQLLMTCGPSTGFGPAAAPPLDSSTATSCADPSEFVGAGDWKVIAGSIGTALILCEAKRRDAVAAYAGVARALAGQ